MERNAGCFATRARKWAIHARPCRGATWPTAPEGARRSPALHAEPLRRTPALLAGAVFAALCVLAPPAAADDAAWEALAEPGTVAIMRHALAPGFGDPEDFTLGDCSTQRNLDARGRAQAREIGAAIRARGIRIDRVLSSEWCRCRETAELLDLGPVEPFPALNSFFEDRSTRDAQTAALRAFLAELPAEETVMLVTHQVNITALTGRSVASGEVFVIRHAPNGNVETLGEILIRP